MASSDVPDIRAFNRFYTRVVGALDEHIIQSPYTLAEARVLYEIGTRGRTAATELSRVLGLDRAYLSRILQKLVGELLVEASPSETDKRSNDLTLTEAGQRAFGRLDSGSDDSIEALLSSVAASDRPQLLTAMRTIRRLLRDEMPASPIVLRPHRLGELGWLIHRQAVLYNEQFGWNAEFETLIARIYHEYEEAAESPPKGLWVADRNGAVAGSVFVTPNTKLRGTAQLRMLYVEPEARGLGLGTTLVKQAVDFARSSGYERMRLWTQSTLVSARRIYAAAGFELVESGPHHSFGKDLVGEYWETAL